MNILRGNDIKVAWSISKIVDGVSIKEDLSTVSNLKVYIKNNGRRLEVDSFIVVDSNKVEFTIKGRDTRIGTYSLEATWTKGYDARITELNAFNVVDDTSQCDNTLTNNSVFVNGIEIKSSLQIAGDLSNYYTKEEVNRMINALKEQINSL